MASILFVAHHFAPENTSGTHRSLHFARALMDAGHEVHVIAGPHPPAERSDPALERVFPWPDRVHRVEAPASIGSLYMGWKRRRLAEASGSHAPTVTPALEGRAPGGAIARLRHHLSVWDALPDQHRAWAQSAVRAGRALGRRIRPSAVFASGPPWSGVMAGHQLARILGVPFIADFRDPWSAGSGATWRSKTEWAQRRVERWEADVLADAAVVCFNSPRSAVVAGARSALSGRVRVILNGSDVPRQTAPVALSPDGPLAFRHFGSLYAGRSVWALVEALDGLIGAGALRPDEVELELIGDAELSADGRARLLSTRVPVRFTPYLKFTDAVRRMGEPSVLISMQTEQHANLIPTKLFDYLCTGNPVLVMSPQASASWDVAGTFGRCRRLDVDVTEGNRVVLGRLIDSWRRGDLRQESSVHDTAGFAKSRIGVEFVELIEEVVGERPVRLRTVSRAT